MVSNFKFQISNFKLRAIQARGRQIRLFLSAIAVFFLLSGIPFSASTQSEDVSLGVSPELPKAGKAVNAQLSSFSLDLDRVRISWRLNGVAQKSGIGEKRFPFVAPKAGERLIVEAAVELSSGETLRRSTTIQPQEIDILWNAFSYTPPFYKGAALPTSEGVITITAMPQMVNANEGRIAKENLIYEWRQDGVNLGSLSGFGKKSITVRAEISPGSQTVVSVLVSSLDGKTRGEGSVIIPTGEPKIVFYEKHPLQGVLYNKALGGSFALEAPEIVLKAEPYYFSLDDVARKALRVRWSLNNSLLAEENTEIAFSAEKALGGASKLMLDMLNTKKVLQEARVIMTVQKK